MHFRSQDNNEISLKSTYIEPIIIIIQIMLEFFILKCLIHIYIIGIHKKNTLANAIWYNIEYYKYLGEF